MSWFKVEVATVAIRSNSAIAGGQTPSGFSVLLTSEDDGAEHSFKMEINTLDVEVLNRLEGLRMQGGTRVEIPDPQLKADPVGYRQQIVNRALEQYAKGMPTQYQRV